tara:strand:- start:1591 stop:2019 length:429 start_codon:yes stop_codon:yes gene_type:complete
MSSNIFNNYIEQIAAGVADVCEIQEQCQLTSIERQSLVQTLTNVEVAKRIQPISASEIKGTAGEGTLEVPPFLYGFIRFRDTDVSQTGDLAQGTQYASDNDNDLFVENYGDLKWAYIEGRYYKSREINIPLGVVATFLFVLK